MQSLADSSRLRLAAVSSPDISVIVPVYNQWRVTARCLASLFRCDTEIAIQLVVVDDGSTDGNPVDMLPRLPGVDIVRNGCNRGFLRSCNRAAKGGDRSRTLYSVSQQRYGTLPLVRLVRLQSIESHPTSRLASLVQSSSILMADCRKPAASSSQTQAVGITGDWMWRKSPNTHSAATWITFLVRRF